MRSPRASEARLDSLQSPVAALDALAVLENAARPAPGREKMTSWWCAGDESYTACGLFDAVEPTTMRPSLLRAARRIELEFVELPKRDGEVEMLDMGHSRGCSLRRNSPTRQQRKVSADD